MNIYTVDAFTDKPFKGNQAGVCILSNVKDDSWMQAIAAEMNLSETAFIVKENNFYNLRWFTPFCEVDLCGHATLASAHILFETKMERSEKIIVFKTKSGELKASIQGEYIVLDFPVEPAIDINPPDNLIKGIKEKIIYCGKSRFDYIVELSDDESVRNLSPDLGLLKSLDCRGIIVTAKSNDENYDFISRFFAPALGVNEDPVTGSAHCTLADYYHKKLNKNEFNAYQSSKRGGSLKIIIKDDRVFLLGKAVTILKGELTV